MKISDIVSICILLSIIFRAILFKKYKEKWWKALIPGYNKYIYGKLCDKKRLGKINAVLIPLVKFYFYFCLGVEFWIIENYATRVQIPYNDEIQSKIILSVPESIKNISILTKNVLIVLMIIALIFWAIMMYHFTIKNKKPKWWIILWVFIPVIPIAYFAFNNTIYIDGKVRKIKKEIKYD